jgi:hypothetical protein
VYAEPPKDTSQEINALYKDVQHGFGTLPNEALEGLTPKTCGPLGVVVSTAERQNATVKNKVDLALKKGEKTLVARYANAHFPSLPPASKKTCKQRLPALGREDIDAHKANVSAFLLSIANATRDNAATNVAVNSTPSAALFDLVPGDPNQHHSGNSATTLRNIPLAEYNVTVTLKGFQPPTPFQLDLILDPADHNISCVLIAEGEKGSSTCAVK